MLIQFPTWARMNKTQQFAHPFQLISRLKKNFFWCFRLFATHLISVLLLSRTASGVLTFHKSSSQWFNQAFCFHTVSNIGD